MFMKAEPILLIRAISAQMIDGTKAITRADISDVKMILTDGESEVIVR